MRYIVTEVIEYEVEAESEEEAVEIITHADSLDDFPTAVIERDAREA